MLDFDSDEICRDDNCDRLDVHPKHEINVRTNPRVHHRPSIAVTPLWERDDPKAMMGAVARACSKAYPMHPAAIVREVRDDYGRCSERTVYRYLAKLVHRGQLVKLDVGLAFSAYLRPKSRLLGDLDSVREYMLGIVECHPTTKEAV